MFQVLWTTLLNVVGVDRQPRELRGYRVSNALQRSLAHLAAQDGSDSRLLLCDSSGRLYVLPVGSTGVAPIYSADGRLGVNLRDAGNDDQAATVNSSGELAVLVQNTGVAAAVGAADGPGNEDLALSVRSAQLNTMASQINDIYTFLYDCYDSVNHALKVVVITP
jgi:hypothetical protein